MMAMYDPRALAAMAEERRMGEANKLIRLAQDLYCRHELGQVDDAGYWAEGAEIKVAAAALGVRLVPFHRGVNCISLQAVLMEEGEGG